MLAPALAELQADPAAAEAAAAAFQRLKPICAQLLRLRQDPQALTAALRALGDSIADLPAAGLRRCYDYITYPLLFMLDAAAAMRAAPAGGAAGGPAPGAHASTASSSSSSVSTGGGPGRPQQALMSVPAMQQDAAVEALLRCVLLLLQRCKGLEADQLLPMLQHVGVLLQLPRATLSEEARLHCLQALTAAVQSQQQLPREQQLPHLPPGRMLGGFLISTCLTAADAEVAAGPTGSKAVRQASIQALRSVVQGVGPGPQLAFALPGLASGLAKQLMASVPSTAGASVTGAAAGSSGTVLVLKTLATVVQLTLGDAAVAHIPDTAAAEQQQQQQQQQQGVTAAAAAVQSSAEALDLLQQLSLQAGRASTSTSNSTTGAVLAQSQGTSQPQPPQPAAAATAAGPAAAPLTAEQDPAWLSASSSKVQTLLALVLPRLLTHTQPAVRQALAEVTAQLLQGCGRALSNSRVALTEILLTLANDDYAEVAQPAVRWLQAAGAVAGGAAVAGAEAGAGPAAGATGAAAATAPQPMQLSDVAARLRKAAAAAASAASQAADGAEGATAGSAVARLPAAPVLSDLLVELCLQLPGAVRQGEASGAAAAKRTAAALLCAGPHLVSSTILSKGPVLQQVCAALAATFQMDPTGAALLLRADAAVLGDLPAAAAAPAGQSSGSTSAAGPASSTEAAKGGSSTGVAYPLLPRMPLSLQYLVSAESYKAAAGVARALGRAARLADLQHTQQDASNMQALLQQLLEQLHAASSPHKPHQQRATAAASPTPAAGEWQCCTAAVAAVLAEGLFGASGAWEPPLAAASLSGAGPAATGGSSQHGGAAGSSQAQGGQWQQQLGVVDAAYEDILLQAVSTVVKPRLWGLPTAQPVEAAAAAGTARPVKLPAQVLGANALLLRSLLDCVGTTARCAGSAFSSGSSRLLRTCLLPLLERLADPCPMVSSAAAGAVDSICRHTGFPLGLSQLVGANADYVVDGVCRQLRSLQQHPRAPQLLAALLREAGVSAALMPLLAEPLRAALSGLSILARQQQPGYVLPFLYVLQSVAAGAEQEAAASRAAFSAQLQDLLAEAVAAGLINPDHTLKVTDSDDQSDSDDSSEHGSCNGAGGAAAGEQPGSSAARYFQQRLQRASTEDPGQRSAAQPQQQQQQPAANGVSATAAPAAAGGRGRKQEVPMLPTGRKLRLAPAQLEELELSWRRAHSAGSLAAAAVDAATPLLLQRNLRCAVLAVQVLTGALAALGAATEAINAEELLFERLVDRGPDAALKPARPTPAKLLPAVHALWPMLLAALQDTGSVPLLEQQLGLLSLLLQLASGKFMARRFKQDAWPLLQRLLKAGPQAGAAVLAASTAASTVGGGAAAGALLGVGAGPGSDRRELLALTDGAGGLGAAAAAAADGAGASGSVFGSALSSMQASVGARSSLNAVVGSEGGAHLEEGGPLAPATLQRVRLAVLGCLAGIAGSASAAAALQGPLVWDVCVLAAPFLADGQALPLREAAAKLLVAAAGVDADAVWLLLLDLGRCFQELSQLLPEAAAVQAADGVSDHPALPQLLSPPPGTAAAGGGGAWSRLLSSAEGVSCGKRAAALLPRAAAAPVAWHDKAEQQLRVLRGAA